MKAVFFTRYGSPEQLQIREIEKPVVEDNEVLVKVKATAVNDWDWSMVRGKPYLYRLMFGISKPKHHVPGMEFSGVVESVGKNAGRFKVGEEVYGDISNYGFGSFAEYLAIDEKALLPKPPEMSFEEAASLPHAAMLALQGLHHLGQVRDHQKILINGAGGGVGTLGLQIVKKYRVEVTGVDTGKKLKMMEALGFDHIIDYKTEDFTRNGKCYDLIFDTKTNRSVFAYLRSLKPGGRYITVGGTLLRLLQIFFMAPFISRFTNKKVAILSLKPNQGMSEIEALFEAGKLKSIMDGPFSLEETPQAIRYFGEGRHTGKVMISVTR